MGIDKAGTEYWHRRPDPNNGRREIVTHGKRQSWQPGDKVNVGFNKGLEVVDEHPHGGVHLKKNEQHYHFQPYGGGLQKIEAPKQEYAVNTTPQHKMLNHEELAKTAESLKHLGAGKPHGG